MDDDVIKYLPIICGFGLGTVVRKSHRRSSILLKTRGEIWP